MDTNNSLEQLLDNGTLFSLARNLIDEERHKPREELAAPDITTIQQAIEVDQQDSRIAPGLEVNETAKAAVNISSEPVEPPTPIKPVQAWSDIYDVIPLGKERGKERVYPKRLAVILSCAAFMISTVGGIVVLTDIATVPKKSPLSKVVLNNTTVPSVETTTTIATAVPDTIAQPPETVPETNTPETTVPIAAKKTPSVVRSTTIPSSTGRATSAAAPPATPPTPTSTAAVAPAATTTSTAATTTTTTKPPTLEERTEQRLEDIRRRVKAGENIAFLFDKCRYIQVQNINNSKIYSIGQPLMLDGAPSSAYKPGYFLAATIYNAAPGQNPNIIIGTATSSYKVLRDEVDISADDGCGPVKGPLTIDTRNIVYTRMPNAEYDIPVGNAEG